jgi:hypothetical protein
MRDIRPMLHPNEILLVKGIGVLKESNGNESALPIETEEYSDLLFVAFDLSHELGHSRHLQALSIQRDRQFRLHL